LGQYSKQQRIGLTQESDRHRREIARTQESARKDYDCVNAPDGDLNSLIMVSQQVVGGDGNLTLYATIGLNQ